MTNIFILAVEVFSIVQFKLLYQCIKMTILISFLKYPPNPKAVSPSKTFSHTYSQERQ